MAGLLSGCSSGPEAPKSDGRLRARPEGPTGTIEPGRHPLGLGGSRDGFLYVPPSYEPQVPAAFATLLHGASGSADDMTGFLPLADDLGILLLVPESRGGTWDLVEAGEFGRDVGFIDDALARAFELCAIDPARLALGGFSDGASYALSLGLTNGDLFSHLIAFSPGFMAPASTRGRPRVFVSHGTSDPVLPIALSRDGIVPRLQELGYDVRYEEFDGGHVVPLEIATAALEWLNT